MLKFIARWWAKRAYLWKLEVEGQTHLLHANLSALHAQQKREQAERLNKDADAIEANIKEVEKRLEAGYWECESGHEPEKVKPSETTTDNFCSECGKLVKFVKRSNMTPQEQYEADKGKREAEKIMENQRAQAAEVAKEVSQLEQTAQHFRRESMRSRAVADEIRKV